MVATSKHEERQALATFLRDLHSLWVERPSQWVAYQGNRRLGFALHKHEMYQRCFRQGLRREEVVVFCIEPQETEITLGSVVLD